MDEETRDGSASGKTEARGNDSDKPFLKAARPPSRGGKLLRAGGILAVIVISGVLVWLIHALGGDERPAGTTEANNASSAVQTTDTGAASGGIRAVNWKMVTDARPMVQDVEDVLYADLNGGGDEEAVVLVRLEGSGAYLSYYVYAWDDGNLEVLFEEKELENGRVVLGSTAGTFVEITPAPGDPASLQYKTYRWSGADEEFDLLSTEIRPKT